MDERNIEYVTIFPSMKIKDEWIKRLQTRYNISGSEKDLRALENGKSMFGDAVKQLSSHSNVIEIIDIDYNLSDIIEEYRFGQLLDEFAPLYILK